MPRTEPTLEFRYGQRLFDPHSGLSLFGPNDADAPSHPRGIAYGVIGPPEGIDAFERWSERIKSPILTAGHEDDEVLDRKQHVLWPSYPGFEAAFAATWHGQAAWMHALDREKLLHAARNKDANHKRHAEAFLRDVAGHHVLYRARQGYRELPIELETAARTGAMTDFGAPLVRKRTYIGRRHSGTGEVPPRVPESRSPIGACRARRRRS